MEENDKARLGQATQHRLLSVAYWRFSVNMSLTVLDDDAHRCVRHGACVAP